MPVACCYSEVCSNPIDRVAHPLHARSNLTKSELAISIQLRKTATQCMLTRICMKVSLMLQLREMLEDNLEKTDAKVSMDQARELAR